MEVNLVSLSDTIILESHEVSQLLLVLTMRRPLWLQSLWLAQGVLVMLVGLSQLASNQSYLILGVDP